MVLLAVVLLFPLGTAILFGDGHQALEQYEPLAFIVTIAACAIIGLGLRSVYELDLSALGHREGAAIVTLSWLVFSLFGCLPFVITGAAGFTDAFFETMSGFTTTGSSILPNVEVLPEGLQLWRCQTQWLGGMGIVVLSVAVFPMVGAGGYRMFKAEAPGGSTFQRNAPRIKDTAKVLWVMYLGMSLVEMTLLLLGGMGGFDAVCHMFTTMSTGGFSTRAASVAAWPTPFIQWTIVAFMLLAGINFDVHQQLLTGRHRQALRNVELRVFVLIAAVATTLFVVVLHLGSIIAGGFETTLRTAAFQVASIGTTTGYGTADFNLWPDTLRLSLLLLMFVGGCTGSTAGGMKVVRVVIFLKSALVELYHTVNPRAVLVVRVGDRPLTRDTVSNVMSFLAIWVALFGLFSYLLTILGLDLISAASAAAAHLGNIGPGLGSVGPVANYAHVPVVGKWLLVFAMLLGRLELYSVLVLLLRKTWIR